MSLRSRLRLGLLLVVAFVAAITVLIAAGIVKECPLALFGSEHEADAGALCRAEFLLNRYQALVAALIALAAAIYAARPVWQQLRLVRVQAASDLLPRLQQEAEEISADEGCVAVANQIVDRLRAAMAEASGSFSGTQVASVIGLLIHIRTGIDGLKSNGAIQAFAHRTTIHSAEQTRRKSFVASLDDVSSACEQIMGIVNPPGGIRGYGGAPTPAYYDEIAPQIAEGVRGRLPGLIKSLDHEIAATTREIGKMKAELQTKTELAIAATRTFVG
jgi:hypothetical protein